MAYQKGNDSSEQPNGNGGTPAPCADTKKIFGDFLTELTEKTIPADKSANAALLAAFNGKKRDVCAERRSYNKTKKTLDFYSSIYYCQAIILCKDVEQAQETLKRKTELAGIVKKGFDGIVASLKILKEKAKTVHDLSCKVDTAIYDSCNTTTKGLINAAIAPDKINETKDNRDKFSKEATIILDAVDQACETSVNVAGLYSYTNVGTIKEHTDDLKSKAEEFKADIESNIKNVEADLKNVQKALADALAKMSLAEADCSRGETVDDGNSALKDVVIVHTGTGDNPSPALSAIDGIINKILKDEPDTGKLQKGS
ncbi:MAG: hypothetical protein KDC61_11785 [Saprospiraceae bacterium]|nr:hypothetical protein [Saprospiraceae bacterium]